MDLIEAGTIICKNFKALRPKEQADWLRQYGLEYYDDPRENLIVEPMVYFNLYMEDEFSHDYWRFFEMIKEQRVCVSFNLYDTWFLWNKVTGSLMSGMEPFDFLPHYDMNLLRMVKYYNNADLYDVEKEEEKDIPKILKAASYEELDDTWCYLAHRTDLWKKNIHYETQS